MENFIVSLSNEGFILSLDSAMLGDLAFQLLNTCILCAVLSYLLYKPVKNMLAERRKKIEGQISSAENQLQDANKLKALYEEKLKAIDKEKEDILSEARNTAVQRSQEIIAEAKKEAETLKNRAMVDIQREQEKAQDEIKKEIVNVSSIMASRILATSIDQEKQDALVDNVISNLEEVKWHN